MQSHLPRMRERTGGGLEMALQLTPAAVAQIRELLSAQGLDIETTFLRMGVKGGGCSGLSYLLDFDTDTPCKHDIAFEIEGIKVVVDKKSYLYINGTTLDYITQGLTGGFTFQNPNAHSSCGCGTSFST